VARKVSRWNEYVTSGDVRFTNPGRVRMLARVKHSGRRTRILIQITEGEIWAGAARGVARHGERTTGDPRVARMEAMR